MLLTKHNLFYFCIITVTLMRSTVVDESLSTNATRVLFQRKKNYFIASRDNRMRNLHQVKYNAGRSLSGQ